MTRKTLFVSLSMFYIHCFEVFKRNIQIFQSLAKTSVVWCWLSCLGVLCFLRFIHIENSCNSQMLIVEKDHM